MKLLSSLLSLWTPNSKESVSVEYIFHLYFFGWFAGDETQGLKTGAENHTWPLYFFFLLWLFSGQMSF